MFRSAILGIGVMTSFAALQTTVAAVNEETNILEKATVVSFTGQEGISTLFTYELDLATSVKMGRNCRLFLKTCWRKTII